MIDHPPNCRQVQVLRHQDCADCRPRGARHQGHVPGAVAGNLNLNFLPDAKYRFSLQIVYEMKRKQVEQMKQEKEDKDKKVQYVSSIL